jgi:hypothetical protein
MTKKKKSTYNPARNYKPSTIKRLFALSGNQCAFYNCNQKIVRQDATNLMTQICHIEGADKGGERYNSASTDDYRRSFENLVLLCPNHHVETNNVEVYNVSVLQKMKEEHENLMLHRTSLQGILTKNSSVLNTVINQIGISLFDNQESTFPKTPPNPEEKIRYNNVIRYKPIIEEYKVYHGKLNRIYSEIEQNGSPKKELLLLNIRTLYLREKNKYKDFNEVKEHADIIIAAIEKELWKIIDNSNNTPDIPYEAIQIGMLIILVDAFMRCKILEEPLKEK